MHYLFVILLSCMLLPSYAETQKEGKYLGSISSETPYWFKDSFLEFEEDVAEAAEENKRVMIYFHQEGCPYCAKLIDENFADPQIEAYVRKHFEGITINMWGDREIVSVAGQSFTEKSFALALKVQYTPTLLFLNERGKTVLRLNGYYPPQKFRQALKFVAQKKETEQSFNEFMLSSKIASAAKGALTDEDFFIKTTDLKSLVTDAEKPLAVYFEAGNCSACDILHQRILSDPATRKLAKKLNSVQLNVFSDEMLITPEGEQLSQRDYARQLNIGYTPSVVLFDKQGKEVHRMEGFLKTFHFQSSLDYVLEKAYLSQPSFQRYISARGEELRALGFDTDIWGYKSSYPADTVK